MRSSMGEMRGWIRQTSPHLSHCCRNGPLSSPARGRGRHHRDPLTALPLRAPAMSTLKAMIVPVTPFQQNCAILWDEDTKHGAVSDPGGDVEAILKAVEKSGVTIDK